MVILERLVQSSSSVRAAKPERFASSEEGTSSSSSMLNLGEGGENVGGSSSEDLCLERLSDGDGSEIGRGWRRIERVRVVRGR